MYKERQNKWPKYQKIMHNFANYCRHQLSVFPGNIFNPIIILKNIIFLD